MAAKKQKISNEPKGIVFFSKWFRAHRGLSQRDLAGLIGVSNSFIAQIELGQHTLPVDYMKMLYHVADIQERQYLMECLYSELDRYVAT